MGNDLFASVAPGNMGKSSPSYPTLSPALGALPSLVCGRMWEWGERGRARKRPVKPIQTASLISPLPAPASSPSSVSRFLLYFWVSLLCHQWVCQPLWSQGPWGPTPQLPQDPSPNLRLSWSLSLGAMEFQLLQDCLCAASAPPVFPGQPWSRWVSRTTRWKSDFICHRNSITGDVWALLWGLLRVINQSLLTNITLCP